MHCEDFKKELAGWLERVWDIEEPVEEAVPPALIEHANGCPECLQRLRAVQPLVDVQGSVKPSPFLAPAVMQRLTGTAPDRRSHKRRNLGLAAAAAVLIGAAGLWLRPFSGEENWKGTLLVQFSLEAPEAESVYVVGDWNDWNPGADPLFDKDSDGVWEAEIRLEPGKEYRYQFHIDDSEWIADPKAALKIDDGFGGKNSILKI